MKHEINAVNSDIDAVEKLHNQALVSYNEEQWQYYASELEHLQQNVRAQNNSIKNRLAGKFNVLLCDIFLSLFLSLCLNR